MNKPASPAEFGSDRREEVLAAAARCFKRLGYQATSMDDVAMELGATKGRVYHHFKSKPDLFFAVYRRAMDVLTEGVSAAAAEPGSAGERLFRMAKAHTLVMMESQNFQRATTLAADLYRFGNTKGEHKETLAGLMAMRRDYENLYRRVIEAGLEDGTIRVPDASVAMKTLLGAINWVAVWYSMRPGETRAHREAVADTVVTTALGGFAPR